MSMLANLLYDWLYLQEKQTCDIPATDSVGGVGNGWEKMFMLSYLPVQLPKLEVHFHKLVVNTLDSNHK